MVLEVAINRLPFGRRTSIAHNTTAFRLWRICASWTVARVSGTRAVPIGSLERAPSEAKYGDLGLSGWRGRQRVVSNQIMVGSVLSLAPKDATERETKRSFMIGALKEKLRDVLA